MDYSARDDSIACHALIDRAIVLLPLALTGQTSEVHRRDIWIHSPVVL